MFMGSFWLVAHVDNNSQ